VRKARIGYSRDMARKLHRQILPLKPPIDVNSLVRLQSLQVKEIKVDDTRWSGAFYRSQKTIAVNSSHSLNRKRFTIAHELGHHCLEHETDEGEFEDQRGFEGSYETGQMNDDNAVLDIELEANEFASEILIPLTLIKKDFASLPVPRQLAKMYQVSETAMFVSLLKHRIFK